MFLGLSNQNLGGLGATYVQSADGTLRPAGNTGQDWNFGQRLMIPRTPYGHRRPRYFNGLGEDKSGKIADVLESISRGLRKDDGWSGGAFGRPIPLQNVLLYGVLAFGAYKLIELVVKR